jgi:hypothetical protein
MTNAAKSKKQKALEALAEAQKKLKEIEDKERLRFANLASKAGLLDVEYDDAEMIKALESVATRFRGKTKQAS